MLEEIFKDACHLMAEDFLLGIFFCADGSVWVVHLKTVQERDAFFQQFHGLAEKGVSPEMVRAFIPQCGYPYRFYQLDVQTQGAAAACGMVFANCLADWTKENNGGKEQSPYRGADNPQVVFQLILS